MANLSLRCECGTVTALVHNVSAANGNHIVCYCNDCQAFARYLGKAQAVLDEQGGTRIFQTAAANVSFTKGRDRLACVKLSPKGILRWYADCCKMPIGNTLGSPALPFVGLIHASLQDGPGGASRDAALSPVRGAVFARFARGGPAQLKHKEIGFLPMMARFARLMLMARWRGDHKRSPFFKAEGKPIAVPHVMSEVERSKAYTT